MEVVYYDGPDALEIPEASGITAQRGNPIHVPDPIGKKLVQQGWEEVNPETQAQRAKRVQAEADQAEQDAAADAAAQKAAAEARAAVKKQQADARSKAAADASNGGSQ